MSSDIRWSFQDATTIADSVDLELTDREAWLALRRQGIGGSDAAAISGLSPWSTPFQLYAEKVGGLPDDRETEAMAWGRRLEPVVRGAVAEQLDRQILPINVTVANVARPWQLANVDGVVVGDAGPPPIYEGKTTSVYRADEWAGGAVPKQYLVQGMHYLAVTGAELVVFGVLIGGQRLAITEVERDPELIDHLITIEARFWQRVIDRDPPSPDGSDATRDFLQHAFDVEPGRIRQLGAVEADRVRHLIAERVEAEAALKEAKEAKGALDNQLRSMIGGAEVLTDESGRPLATWKQVTSHPIDTDRLRADEPTFVERYTTERVSRRLHIPATIIKELQK